MFTGIVEETGKVISFVSNTSDAVIKIRCDKVLAGTVVGDSISINGVCQTVTEISNKSISAQVSNETLRVTNFSRLKANDEVNLERALTLQSRLGGHIVSGHVDATAKLVEKQKTNEFYNLVFEVEKDILKYIVKKGSVALNGVSLTVAELLHNGFSIAVIPHTIEVTALKNVNIGEFVNLEVDILSKYVEKFLSREDNVVIDENFLKENGF